MKKNLDPKNGHIYFILANIFVVSIIVCIVIYQSYESRTKALAENANQVNSMSLVVEEAIQSSFSGIEIVLDQFAFDVKKYGSVEKISLAELAHYKSQIIKINSVYLNWADETGQLRWNSEGLGDGPGKSKINIADRDYFKYLKNNNVDEILISEPIFGKIRKKWVIAIVRGLRSKNGKFLGVAWGSVSNDYFIDLKNKTHISDNDVFVVASGNPLKFFYRSNNHDKVVGTNFKGPIEARPVVDNLVHRGVYQVISPVDGHRRISAFSKVGKLPVLVVVGRDVEAALMSWKKETYVSLGLAFFGILMSIFFLVSFLISHNKYRIYQAQLLNSSKLAALGEMSGSIAHEINNPLMVITGHVERISKMLKRGPVSEEELNYSLEKIKNTLSRVSNIISGLRKISNQSDSKFSNLEVDPIINEAITIALERYRANGVDIFSDLKLTGIKAPVNETQINQVLINLLNNSFDEIAGTSSPWVKIESVKEDNKIRIYFTDSGRGIPADVAEKMMTPFFTTKISGKGTGLGLSISKEIIEMHGGRFWYNANCPNTQFVIEIPIKETQLIETA